MGADALQSDAFPDRSGIPRNFKSTDANPDIDLGWCQVDTPQTGPFTAELWLAEGSTLITFFVLEKPESKFSEAEFLASLADSQLLMMREDGPYVATVGAVDARSRKMYSVNVVVETEGTWIATCNLKFHLYADAP